MSDAAIEAAGGETRLAMLRVWMAISAVWVAFWLAIAGVIVLTGALADPLVARFDLLSAIVVVPPLALLTLGAVFRILFETVSASFRNS